MENIGAAERNYQRMLDLIEKAKQWTVYGYSEAYVQSQLWASRDEHTSINDIAEAIRLSKLPVIPDGSVEKYLESLDMPDYHMYNFNGDKGFFVGKFENDEKFWEYYFANKETIDFRCKKFDEGSWHMHRMGREIKSKNK